MCSLPYSRYRNATLRLDSIASSRTVVGFGQPESNRISVWVKTEDGKTDVTYPDLPYVAWMDHDGDFSWNSNNYVHGPMARIKPRK